MGCGLGWDGLGRAYGCVGWLYYIILYYIKLYYMTLYFSSYIVSYHTIP